MSAHFSHEIFLACSAGKLEGRLSYREENEEKPGVILCPPHPLLAGNMENNVIRALTETLACHFPVLSFNYRGVGKSFKAEENLPLFEYWSRLEENNDFSAIIADTRDVIALSGRYFKKFHLVGYSFGSFIGFSALPATVLSFAGITPPLGEHDFQGLETLSCKTFFLFAGKENLLMEQKNTLPRGAVTTEIPESDHFFLGREHDVAALLEEFLLAV